MTAPEFPLLTNTHSAIKRDYHTLFTKYRYFDIFLPYLASKKAKYDIRLSCVVYYDICTIAIENYVNYKAARVKLMTTTPSAVTQDFYTNFDPEAFDVVLHKALHHITQEIFYIQPRKGRANKYDAIHEVSDPNTIYSNMFKYYHPPVVDFESNDIPEFVQDDNPLTLSDYIADYVILAKRMSISRYCMIDLIQHMFNHIRDYMHEYYGIIYKGSYVRYNVSIVQKQLHVTYTPNSDRIKHVETKLARGSFKSTPECLALGITSVSMHTHATPATPPDLEPYIKTLKPKLKKISLTPLQTVKGRTLRFNHLYIDDSRAIHTREQLAERATKFMNAFPNPTTNASSYLNRMNYHTNYSEEKCVKLRRVIHRLLKLRSVLYLTLHVSVDAEVCSQYYLRNVDPIAKLVKFKTPDILCLSSDDDYKLLDVMFATYKAMKHVRTYLSCMKLDFEDYRDVANDILVNDAMLITKSMLQFYYSHVWHEHHELHRMNMTDEYKLFFETDQTTLAAIMTSLMNDVLADCQAIYNIDLQTPYVQEKIVELKARYDNMIHRHERGFIDLVYIRIDPAKMGYRLGCVDYDYGPEDAHRARDSDDDFVDSDDDESRYEEMY